jgi:hypothetical protein
MTISVIVLFVSVTAHAAISISVLSDPAGVTLAGSGTHAASFAIGTVKRNGGTLPVGVTRSKTASNWTLSIPFDIQVTGSSGTGFALQASLTASDAVRVWKLDSVTLNSSSAVTIVPNGTYGTTVLHTLTLTIPNNAAAGSFSNTISLLAVSN